MFKFKYFLISVLLILFFTTSLVGAQTAVPDIKDSFILSIDDSKGSNLDANRDKDLVFTSCDGTKYDYQPFGRFTGSALIDYHGCPWLSGGGINNAQYLVSDIPFSGALSTQKKPFFVGLHNNSLEYQAMFTSRSFLVAIFTIFGTGQIGRACSGEEIEHTQDLYTGDSWLGAFDKFISLNRTLNSAQLNHNSSSPISEMNQGLALLVDKMYNCPVAPVGDLAGDELFAKITFPLDSLKIYSYVKIEKPLAPESDVQQRLREYRLGADSEAFTKTVEYRPGVLDDGLPIRWETTGFGPNHPVEFLVQEMSDNGEVIKTYVDRSWSYDSFQSGFKDVQKNKLEFFYPNEHAINSGHGYIRLPSYGYTTARVGDWVAIDPDYRIDKIKEGYYRVGIRLPVYSKFSSKDNNSIPPVFYLDAWSPVIQVVPPLVIPVELSEDYENYLKPLLMGAELENDFADYIEKETSSVGTSSPIKTDDQLAEGFLSSIFTWANNFSQNFVNFLKGLISPLFFQ